MLHSWRGTTIPQAVPIFEKAWKIPDGSSGVLTNSLKEVARPAGDGSEATIQASTTEDSS